MDRLRIELLGGLSLAWGPRPLPPIPGAAARSLLAFLIVRRQRPHTRDLLAGTFWPDLPETTARQRLRQALWQIQTALDPHPILLIEGDTVQLNPELPLWLDVEAFEAQAQDPDPALEPLKRAAELYQGDLLAGYYDDWLLLEREHLRVAYLEALERLVEGLKAAGAYREALTYARRLAAEDALREEAHREVMRLCHLLGRDHEALQQYEVCRGVLAEELAAEPSPGTARLAAEIRARVGVSQDLLRQGHLPVAAPAAPLPLWGRPDQVPLVGRQAERAEMARWLEMAMQGNGGLVLVAGEAGAGKTRLMEEVARDAAWRGLGVAWGHSCELSAPMPHQPLREVLSQADLSPMPEVWRRELGRLLPGDPGTEAPVGLEGEGERGRLLEAVVQALLALGRTAPHLVILEDVHWMDIASFEVLRLLLPRLAGSRLLVVCTLRPEDLATHPVRLQCLAALEQTRLARRLALANLNGEETERLVQEVLDLAAPAPRFSRRLHLQTGGNPFFLTETLRALVDGGLLYRREDGQWATPWDRETEDYAELPVPDSVAQSIEQRLAYLAPDVRALLEVAATIGRQIAFELWVAAGEAGEAATLKAAEEAARRGLLLIEEGAQAGDGDGLGLAFAHDMIRQGVYEGMGPLRRRLVHRRVAAVLETLHPDQVEALARHTRLGQKWAEAVVYARRAGERAQQVYANELALDYYRRADRWLAEGRCTWPAEEIARWQAELAERQGEVHSLVGAYEEAQAAFARAGQTWAALGDQAGEARVLNRQSFLAFVQGDYATAGRRAAEALAVLPEVGRDLAPKAARLIRATSLTNLGLAAWSEGQYDEALPPLEEALGLFEAAGGDAHGLARCLNSLGLVHLERGALALAEEYLARSLALRREIGDRRGEGFCHYNQARVAIGRGDGALARAELETAHQIFAEIEAAEGLETCARLLRALEQGEVVPAGTRRITVRLPRANAPTGRPLERDEYLAVTWTVEAGQDAEIEGKVERRRHRLRRLLGEAEAQGAAPTVDDLAAALEASRATVKRDLAALRAAGYEVRTRGSRQE